MFVRIITAAANGRHSTANNTARLRVYVVYFQRIVRALLICLPL